MTRPTPLLHGLVLSVACAWMAHAEPLHAGWFNLLPSEVVATETASWEPMPGDTLVVDTTTNIGYLVHANGGYTSFLVVTGQRRVVRYIGRTYFAATPNKRWTSFSNERKGRSVTFGEDGTFLRLYDEGERTAYGIHSHLSIAVMLSEDERYRSMGCILVSEEMLDVIEKTFTLNGGRLDVLTTSGFGDMPVNAVTLKQKIAADSQS